jgi:hypothetical protein
MKQLLKATVMFIASLTLLTAVIYAWFTNSNYSIIQPINNQVIQRNVDMEVQFGINGGGYESFNEPAEINAYLMAMNPGDFINIKVIIHNTNDVAIPDMLLEIMMNNIRATDTSDTYNLTDFYYIENGTIYLTWYDSPQSYELETSYQTQSVLLSQIDEASIDYIGVPLESYRLSNMFNHYMDGETMIIDNDITILNTTLVSQHLIVVEFSLGLDPYTPDTGVGFQDGELFIDGLYTFFGE